MTTTNFAKMRKADLLEWATQRCLLEHLDPAAAAALTKKALLAEINGAMIFTDHALEIDAAVTNGQRYKGDVLDSIEGIRR